MHLWNRRTVLAAGGAVAGAAALDAAFPSRAQAADRAPLVHTAGVQSAAVDSVVVFGERKALVIDAQFVKPEAEALAAEIEASGREVETIFITHYHPDHHFGVAVLTARWPNARLVAHPKVAAKLGQMGQAMFDGRKAAMGDLLPDDWRAPEPLDGDRLMLEGEAFDVLDPMHGDTTEITPVRLPQFDALVASDIVFNGTHLWLAENTEEAGLDAWRATLDAIEAMGMSTIIPGHRVGEAANDATGLAHTRKLLDAWSASLAASSSKDALRKSYVSRVGELPGAFFLEKALDAAYPS